MGSVHKEILIDIAPEDAWAALRDFGGVHERLATGFVTDARLDGDTRVVTFFNGAVARELLVDIDDEARRLVYSVVESPLEMTHHNASVQLFADGNNRTRYVWIADLLPNDAAAPVSEMTEQGSVAMKKALESQTARP